MGRTRLEWAQWLVTGHAGIKALIVDPNSKRPLGGNSWYVRNTNEPQQLAEWFDMTPNCNWGAHLGPEYVVIDLDWKPGGVNGIEAFEEICRENGIESFLTELDTLMVATPSGGYHLYFKTPEPCANKNTFPDGIDVRGARGYVVGPGSQNTQGTWDVIDPDMPIMDIPGFLLEYLDTPGIKDPNHEVPLVELDREEDIQQAVEWLKKAKPAIANGTGDQDTYDICCMLRDFGISETEALRILNESGWNERCEPAWEDGELEAKIKNSYAYGQNRPGIKSASYQRQNLMAGRPVGGYAAIMTSDRIAEMFRPKSQLELVVDNVAPQAEADPDIPQDVADDEDPMDEFASESQLWYGLEEFAAIDRVREYIVKDWLIAHGVTALLAKRGTGKSTLALDLACHLATDRDWWDLPTMREWCIIYVCGEDDEGMILNVRAWAQYHGEMPSSDRFLVAKGIIKMTNQTELAERLREMKEWARDRRCVIILDTWARATSGYSSNTQEEMDTAYENAEKVAKALKGPMIACFHPPKDGRMTIRGSAVQEDASSGIWNLEKVTEGMLLTIGRAKGRGEGNYRKFRIEQVTLPGVDFYGEPLQGIVPLKVAGTEDDGKADSVARMSKERRAWAKAVIGAVEIFPSQHYEVEKPEPNVTAVSVFLTNMWISRNDKSNPLAGQFVDEWMDEIEEQNQMQNVTTADYQGIRRQLDERFFQNKHQAPVVVDGATLSVILKPTTKKTYIFIVGEAELAE